MDATDVTRSYDCKTPGCENAACGPVGINSYCTDCQKARGVSLSEASRQAAATRSERNSGRTTSGSFEQKARTLIKAARRLDTARLKATAAMQEVRDAQTAYTALCRDLGLPAPPPGSEP